MSMYVCGGATRSTRCQYHAAIEVVGEDYASTSGRALVEE